MISALCFVCRFGARTDDGRSVVVNVCVIGPDSCWLRERLAVASDVSGFWLNNADEVVDRSRFVLEDLKEERSDVLSKSCEVIVRRVSADGLKVVEGEGKFRHNLLGSHAPPEKMAGPSS